MKTQHPKQDVPLTQLRQFGWLMGGVFALVTFWPLVVRGEDIRMWSGIIAGIFGVLGTVFPNALKPIFRGWMIFGEKIGWVNSRILLGIVFYGLLTPISLLIRVLGKRPLQLSFDPQAETYRVPKEPRAANHVLKAF
ncbi:MAG: SxtJ family membrane protein [Nitrospirota bacterium]|nr:SxtJ family membrane protein [Nitrospirota bacterium]